ncbi:hypothetical protein ACX0G9_23215 [Flavitalea flava]
MKLTPFKRKAGQLYLILVPFLTIILAFVTGHISYKIYLPIWIINVLLMIIAAWVLGAHVVRKPDVEKKHIAIIALFLIIPWMFMSIFFGMGPPPETAKEWVATATEQQARFSILIFSGILIALGLAILRDKLKTAGENFYSQLGIASILIAIPIFLLAMAFWHSFALEAFRAQVASPSDKMPEWFKPVLRQIWVLTMVEVMLTYLATAAFAASLRSLGWLNKTPSGIYIILSVLSILCIVLYPIYPASVTSAGFPYYPFMIPAIAFLMLYFIGINLLRRVGNKTA